MWHKQQLLQPKTKVKPANDPSRFQLFSAYDQVPEVFNEDESTYNEEELNLVGLEH